MRMRISLQHKPLLSKLSESEAATHMRRASALIIAKIAAQEAELFEQSKSPSGASWAPLKDSTLELSKKQAMRLVGGKKAGAYIKRRGDLLIAVAKRRIPGKQRTARVRRTEKSKILVDTGLLRASVISQVAGAGAVRKITKTHIDFGTRIAYANDHQFGVPERNLPARPFLGLSAETRRAIEDIYIKAIRLITG